MYKQAATITFLALCAALFPAAQQAVAEAYEFTYTTTTDPAYDNSVHMLNTGIFVNGGETVDVVGAGTILFSYDGYWYVMTNYDMGLVSPLDVGELQRDYTRQPGDAHGEPVPLAGESVLFTQDRDSTEDHHDLEASVVAQTDGYLYIGLVDEYFEDNSGSHFFQLDVTPEPSSIVLLGGLALVVAWRRRRATIRR